MTTRFGRASGGGLLALCLLAAGLSVATPFSSATAATPLSTPDPYAAAADTGERVELEAARTETDTVFANPDGTTTKEMHSFPIRAQTREGWKPVDFDLTRGTDGLVRPKVAPGDTVLSGGGDDPLISSEFGSIRTEQSWPEDLPEPVLEGNTATYPEVFDGVDLVLSVTETGTSHVLVVKDEAAAANPDLRSIELPIEVEGGSVEKKADGALAFKDEFDRVVGIAPEPAMWDSAGRVLNRDAEVLPDHSDAAIQKRIEGPTEGDDISGIPTSLSDDVLTLKPPEVELTGSDVAYPLFLDPVVSPADHSRAMVFKENPNTKFYNWGDSNQGVGYQTGWGEGTSTKRLFYKFSTKLAGKKVISSSFRVKREWAGSCTDTTITLYRTSTISSSTTWNNQPDWSTSQGGVLDTLPSGCDLDNVEWLEWNSMQAAQSVASSGNSTITFGLRNHESDRMHWRRLDSNANFSVTYNTPPGDPTSLRINSGTTKCRVDPYVHDDDSTIGPGEAPRYMANFSDADSGDILTAYWETFRGTSGTGTPIVAAQTTQLAVGNGRINQISPVAPVDVDANGQVLGGVYTYRVRVQDNSALHSYSRYRTCTFEIDPGIPGKPTVSMQPGAIWTYPGGDPQTLTFWGPTDGTPFSNFVWSVNGTPQQTASAGGAASISVPINAMKAGINWVVLWSQNGAGTLSAPVVFWFEASSVFGDGAGSSQYDLNEGTGNTAADRFSRHISLTGVPMAWDEVGQYVDPADSVEKTDHRLSFGATPSSATVSSAASLISTADSYTVSAWVDPALAVGEGGYALSHGTSADSEFRLGVTTVGCPVVEEIAMPRCYEFGVRHYGSSLYTSAYSTTPVLDQELVHIIGTFSVSVKKVDICVFDEEAGCIFEESANYVVPTATPVGSVLRVGQAQVAGSAYLPWKGFIDHIFVGRGIPDEFSLDRLHRDKSEYQYLGSSE